MVLAMLLLEVATSLSSNGRERTGVTGIVILVQLLLVMAISPASNGRERMDAPGIVGLVSMLLKEAICTSSNRRERMDVLVETNTSMCKDDKVIFAVARLME